jgi:Zn-dependent protease
MFTILSIVILILSVVIHEVSHGYMADRLGDPTPRLQGRLTLNPLKHLDPVGSFVVPVIMLLASGGRFGFGWARPVEYNPYNIKNKRQGEFLIAIAGPLSNLLIALIFSIIFRSVFSGVVTPFIEIAGQIILLTIGLAIFNLIPIPPLDGSKLLFSILPNQYGNFRFFLERYSPVFILIVVFFLWEIISPLVPIVFGVFTGVGL